MARSRERRFAASASVQLDPSRFEVVRFEDRARRRPGEDAVKRGPRRRIERQHPQRATLVRDDEAFETVASLIHFATFDQFSNFDCET